MIYQGLLSDGGVVDRVQALKSQAVAAANAGSKKIAGRCTRAQDRWHGGKDSIGRKDPGSSLKGEPLQLASAACNMHTGILALLAP